MAKEYKKKPLAELHVKQITGSIGTTICPGEEVMVVRSGYSNNVYCEKGRYIGYIISEPSKRIRARVVLQREIVKWYHPDGREFNWKKEYNYITWNEVKDTLHTKTHQVEVISTLNLNRIATLK